MQRSIGCISQFGYAGASTWGYPVDRYGNNCTNYAAFRLAKNGAANPGNLGNAIDWDDNARRKGFAVDANPAVGAIAQWNTNTFGHVAYVDWVRDDGNEIAISESSFEVSGFPSASRRRVLTRGSSAWPHNFIHIKDLANGNPFGSAFDAATSPSNGRIRVAGWAVDPDARSTPIAVHVYVGGPAGSGAPGYAYTADGSRPDVASAVPGAGDRHGFDVTIDVGRGGSIPVYVYAINAGGTPGGNTLLGSRTIAVGNPTPVGHLDEVTSPEPGVLALRGWGFDPDAPTRNLTFHAYIGGPAGSPGAEFRDLGVGRTSRADVARAYPGAGGNQGFDIKVTTGRQGDVPVYVYAINLPGTSGTNPLLGNLTARVADPSPFGNLDDVEAPLGGRVHVRGWMIDPNRRTAAGVVHVYVGGPAGTAGADAFQVVAGRERGDVAAAQPGAGANHGFEASLETTKRGTQQVFVYLINTPGTPGGNRLLGQRTVSISEPLPVTNRSAPRIVGTASVGRTVSAHPGEWSPSGLTFRYQWRAGSSDIAGATSSRLRLTNKHRGQRISVVVTASRPGYATTGRSSAGLRVR